MKPDWKDAPPGAEYVAMDANGYWFWHSKEPKWNGRFWFSGGWHQMATQPTNAWETLEKKP